MTRKRWLSVLAGVVIAVGLAYAAFSVYRGSQAEQCYACQRVVHAHMRTVGIMGGRERVFCCPACALSEHEQIGKPIQITELTDFLTGAKMAPDRAFLVKGSDVNMCAQTRELVGVDKRPAELHYDRCAPSLLAFGQRSDAVQFVREHRGEVLSFSEIASAFAH